MVAGIDLGVGPGLFALLCLTVFAGALLQGVVGIGIGLLGAPVVSLLRPDLMPGLMIVLALLLPMFTLVREHSDIDWPGLGWAVPPRIVGTVVGVVAVSLLSDRLIGLAIGLLVLLAVLVSWRAVHIPVTRRTLVGAGLISGVTGTTASIGGPPLALLYQRRPPEQARPTIAVYFIFGAGLSLAGLGLAGEFTAVELRLAMALIPALLVGVVLAIPLRERVPRARVRAVLLVVCGLSAGALVVRSLLG